MIKYTIRSIALLNIVNDVKVGRLIPDAYFQRNLVWREVHKKDFIETVLEGYPFPQMFFSRGKIDIEQMTSTSCIVDGQQRTSAIIEFVDNKFSVHGRYFKDLDSDEKSAFLKYEIAVVELDLDNDSPHILEIFKRLNRTANSLTTIEKLASEYAPTEYMYVARLLANDTDPADVQADLEEEDWRIDPNLPLELVQWAKTKKSSLFSELVSKLDVFSEREIARKVHLMYVLNIMSTILGGFFNRNEKTSSLLEDYKDNFEQKDFIYDLICESLSIVNNLSLENHTFWSAKANFFSLIVAIAKRLEEGKHIDIAASKEALQTFSPKPEDEYTLAAREAVNNKKERQLRNQYVAALLT
ncbi:MAG: GmrSD restriction endonuclease domain-containing protein [Sulfuriferula sp.]